MDAAPKTLLGEDRLGSVEHRLVGELAATFWS
jgi:hypothetical protein